MNIVTFSRWLTLVSYFSLLTLLMLWTTLLSPPLHAPISLMLLVLVGPLLLPLRGLLHGRPYTHAWTSFLVLLYFLHGVVELYANPAQRLYAGLEILFSVGLYCGAILFARYRGRELKALAAPDNRAQTGS
jgi:uncharacterized membrane protein